MIAAILARARAARRLLPVAAPRLLLRADPDRRRRPRAAGSSPTRSSARAARPSSSTARSRDDNLVTQFELLTAAAYSELARRQVRGGVIEAGLGGRYDATNVIPSRVQVLTERRARAHAAGSGRRSTAIAREKLDVVQPGATLVLGSGLTPTRSRSLRRSPRERGAEIVRAGSDPGVRGRRARRLPAPQLRGRAGRGRRHSSAALDPRAVAAAAAGDPGAGTAAGDRTPRRGRCSTAPTTPTGSPRSPSRCRRSPRPGRPVVALVSCSTTRT